ncbi:MAG: transglutaminase-like domain-containing protein [Candidatus Binatia bacterium]
MIREGDRSIIGKTGLTERFYLCNRLGVRAFLTLLACLLVAAVEFVTLPRHAVAEIPDGRHFSFTYELEVGPVPEGEGPIDVFLPIARSDPHQDVLSHEVKASIPGREETETTYGNRFWHGHLERSKGRAITVTTTYRVRRHVFHRNRLAEIAGSSYTAEEKREHALFLEANRRVPVSGELVESIVREIAPGETSLVRIARATYDYVIDNMEYKKVGTGWGNGDTYWACSAKYGNCTDFHALFTSLVRARGIPARFEIGFPVPMDRPGGEIGGYHCWVEFYLPEVGWVPIDASAAKKRPEMRDLFFGTHFADRIKFSVGRDLELGEGHRTGPLNYFVYPHVELGGKPYGEIKRRFAFSELDRELAALPDSTRPR